MGSQGRGMFENRLWFHHVLCIRLTAGSPEYFFYNQAGAAESTIRAPVYPDHAGTKRLFRKLADQYFSIKVLVEPYRYNIRPYLPYRPEHVGRITKDCMVNHAKSCYHAPPLFFLDYGPRFMLYICVPGHDDKELIPEFT